jgi:hypothetical protein
VIESSPAFLIGRAPRAKAAAAAKTACTETRMKRQRPLVAGISVAHHDVTAGTLAYFCRSRRPEDGPDRVFILSNNHVLANINKGWSGDSIYQPGPADGGAAADQIGQLTRFKAFDLDGGPNKIDAAIAELAPDIAWRPELCTIGAIAGVTRGVEDMEVRKHGRTTGYTEGLITDDTYDAVVGMDHNDPTVVGLFQNQLRIETTSTYPAFGLGGDSGSLVVQKSSATAVGLYFAGPPNGRYGIANHIDDVLSGLDIDLWTGVQNGNVA